MEFCWWAGEVCGAGAENLQLKWCRTNYKNFVSLAWHRGGYCNVCKRIFQIGCCPWNHCHTDNSGAGSLFLCAVHERSKIREKRFFWKKLQKSVDSPVGKWYSNWAVTKNWFFCRHNLKSFEKLQKSCWQRIKDVIE